MKTLYWNDTFTVLVTVYNQDTNIPAMEKQLTEEGFVFKTTVTTNMPGKEFRIKCWIYNIGRVYEIVLQK